MESCRKISSEICETPCLYVVQVVLRSVLNYRYVRSAPFVHKAKAECVSSSRVGGESQSMNTYEGS